MYNYEQSKFDLNQVIRKCMVKYGKSKVIKVSCVTTGFMQPLVFKVPFTTYTHTYTRLVWIFHSLRPPTLKTSVLKVKNTFFYTDSTLGLLGFILTGSTKAFISGVFTTLTCHLIPSISSH